MRKRVLFPLLLTWILYIVLCGSLVNYVKASYEEKTIQNEIGHNTDNTKESDNEFSGETVTGTEEMVEETTTEEQKANPLKEVKGAKLNTLIEEELKAMADGDVETLRELDLYQESYRDEEAVKKAGEVVEYYDNIQSYAKNGLLDHTYLIFTVADTKIKGCETLAPTMFRFYVEKDETGEFHINTQPAEEMDSTIYMYLANAQNEEDVLELIANVNQEFADACQKDENLKKIVTGES